MKYLMVIFACICIISGAVADLYPAASVGYIRDVMADTGLCHLHNRVPDSVAANMEYLMNAIDICNRGITQYARSEYATHEMANTNAVQKMKDLLYVSDGLLIALDVDNMDDWIIIGDGTIEYLSDGIKMHNKYLRTRDTLDLSPYQNVTIEVRFHFVDPMDIFHFEHSSNWNAAKCGFGFVLNIQSETYEADVVHSNAHGPSVNYYIKTTDLISHTLVKTFTTVDDAHHLTFYDGIELTEPIRKYGEMSCSSLRNDYFFVGCRDGQCGDHYRAVMHSLRIYNHALTGGEVCHNAWVDYRRFGGARPDCKE